MGYLQSSRERAQKPAKACSTEPAGETRDWIHVSDAVSLSIAVTRGHAGQGVPGRQRRERQNHKPCTSNCRMGLFRVVSGRGGQVQPADPRLRPEALPGERISKARAPWVGSPSVRDWRTGVKEYVRWYQTVPDR